MKRVVIHIDRLVLQGFPHEDGHAIAIGLHQELARSFGDRGAVQRFSAATSTSRLQVGRVRIEHGSKPQRVGASVARGIVREIKT